MEETFDLSETTLAKHENNFPKYVRDIESEVNLKYDLGELFKPKTASTGPRSQRQHGRDLRDVPVLPELRRFEQTFQTDLDFDEDIASEENEGGEWR